MKRYIITFAAIAVLAILSLTQAQAQPAGPWDSSHPFVVRDGQTLSLDFYFPGHWQQSDTLRPCMIFVYGDTKS